MNAIQKSAQSALNKYVEEQRATNETSAMCEDRLIKAKDAGYGALYSAGYGTGATVHKAAQTGLDSAIEVRVKKFRRDDESFEQALARCAREDTVTRALYAVAHG